jgi:ABC-type multidrug transport system fused ATPase/permease subunit
MLAWFAKHLGPHWWKLLLATVAMVGSSAASAYVPVVLGQRIVQESIVGQHLERLGTYIGWLAGLFLLTQVLSAVRMNIMHQLGQRFVYDLRLRAYEHLERLPLSYFHAHNTGDIMSRISNDVGAVEDMVVHGTDNIISNGVMVVAIVFILFRTHPTLALVALAPLPVFVGSIVVFARLVRPLYERIRAQLGDINTKLQENISGIQVVKAFGREAYELEEFRATSEEYLRLNIKGIWMWTTFFPFLGLLTSMGMVVVIWLGGLMTRTHAATLGVIIVFLGELQQFYRPVGELIRVYDVFNRALAALARIFRLLDEQPEVSDPPDAIELRQVQGRVEIDHVSFRYPTGELVLRDVTVTAEPGETVAIVGRSGAGKTSLVNLLPRFYDPQEGTIRLDGIDLRRISLASLRAQIGMVLQDTFLFDGTVKENIRYGRLDATDEEIVAAAQAAYAHEFIINLPQGYDTVIGERGVKLSGGQRQRIAIARALLKNPRVLILDEATSLVDTEAEEKIQAALQNLMRGRTTFVIAHRLSTVRKADKIVVIDEGEVVEQADHETLMRRGGLYAEMYTRQFQLEQYGIGPGLGRGLADGAEGL